MFLLMQRYSKNKCMRRSLRMLITCSSLDMLKFALLFVLLAFVASIELTIPLGSRQRKCYSEDIGKGVLFVGEFISLNESSINISISDPEASLFEEKGVTNVKKAFTTANAGVHKVCMENTSNNPIKIQFDLSFGAQARDYQQIARKEHLDPFELSLTSHKHKMTAYKRTLFHMRQNADKTAYDADVVSSRMIWCTVGSIIGFVVVTQIQIFVFKRFLHKKKII